MKNPETRLYVNIGCGMSPTPGWRNFDNSPSLVLAKLPILARLLRGTGLITDVQLAFIEFASKSSIEWGDPIKGLPLERATVDVLYTCHMLEHLDRRATAVFLAEARRLLKLGGIIRVVVPDLRRHVDEYRALGDADRFMTVLDVAQPDPRSLIDTLRVLALGQRNHRWMYDAESLCGILLNAGFEEPVALSAGSTRIPEPGMLNLRERQDESLYVEALQPRV